MWVRTDGWCVCVFLCTISVHMCYQKRFSAVQRHYCVIGLSQPRYVMLNLVAETTRKKGEWKKNYKFKVKCISANMSTSDSTTSLVL